MNPLLQVSTIEQLKNSALPKSWAALARYRYVYPDAPIYKLLDSASSKTFAESAYILLHGKGKCKTCNADTSFATFNKGFSKYCSRTCCGKDTDFQQTNKEKRQKTMLAKYGASSTLGSAELKQKVQKTNLERYGHLSPASNNDVRNKITKTVNEKYGGNSPNTRPDIKEKQSQVQQKRADTRKIEFAKTQGFEIISGEALGKTISLWKCKEGHVFKHSWLTTQISPICRICIPYIRGTSKEEKQVADFVQTLANVKPNHRLYTSKKEYREIDVYIPAKKIGIEYNGLYWHSEIAGKDKTYHLDKLKLAEQNGIHLIQIFEHEWINKRDICESIIKSKLQLSAFTIGARKLVLKEVPKEEAKNFFLRTHISGAANFKKAFGLYLDSKLICCSAWGAGRFGSSNVIELIRFSSELGYSVPGALSRLTNAAHKEWPNMPLKSFCDRRFGTGNAYIKAGWELSGESSPGYWYFDKNFQVIHRLSLQKKTLLQKLCYDDSKYTEWELAQIAGYNRFWDCGNLIFTRQARA